MHAFVASGIGLAPYSTPPHCPSTHLDQNKECVSMKKPLFRNHTLSAGIFVFAIMLAAASSRTQAGEQRHHDAHVHGVAHLNAAMEGTSLHLEFTNPAANIVGFEHQPRTPEQKDDVRDAIEKLEEGSKLFILSPEAHCRLSKFSVKTNIEHDAGHDKDADHEKEHEHKKDAHQEKEHEHEKDAHHGKGEDNDKDHHEKKEDEHARHSEFHSEYRFVCKNPGKLSQMDVMLIQTFPGIEHIEVQLLTETKQSAHELTAQNHRIKF
jgi:hypothetical protein